MLTALLFASAGVWPQLVQIERYIDVCESAYMAYSKGPLPTEVDHISVRVGKDNTSIGFVVGDLGLITGTPTKIDEVHELIWYCYLENRTEEVYALGRNLEAAFIPQDIEHNRRDVAPGSDTEFDVVEFRIEEKGRRFLGTKPYSNRGLSLYFKRVFPSDVQINGYHSLPSSNELAPSHGGLELPLVEASRYQDNGDGTVTEKTTGLMWQRCAVGREWREGRCEGEAL
ncbi:hypothetical protein QWF21_18020, partial [Alkalimonas sp. MEB004]|nr:hypothetical protein [Alkalimonas sp. MEB004]